MPPNADLATGQVDDLDALLADLADLSVEELLKDNAADLDPQAILCSCCCSWCGC